MPIVKNTRDAYLFYIYAQPPQEFTEELEAAGLIPQGRFGHHITIYRPYQCMGEEEFAIRNVRSIGANHHPITCTIDAVIRVGEKEEIKALRIASTQLQELHQDIALRMLVGGSVHESNYFSQNYRPHVSLGDIDARQVQKFIGHQFTIDTIYFISKEESWGELHKIKIGTVPDESGTAPRR